MGTIDDIARRLHEDLVFSAPEMRTVHIARRLREAAELGQEARDLLAEATEYGEWTHEHCDEDGGGNHRLDTEQLERDAHDAIRAFDEAFRSP